MMRSYRPFLIVIVFSIGLGGPEIFAQNSQDTVTVDTLRNKYVPTGVRLGFDLISAGKSYFQDNFNGWEFQGDVDLNRYYLAVEYGRWGLDRATDSVNYNNAGNYWRVGVDVNFLKDRDRNVFFLGARYGRSVFSESMSVVRYDRTWGLQSDTFHHSNVNASWIELTTGLKVKIFPFVWLGYTARFKFALSSAGTSDMLPYDVPGFGNTSKETTWGFNYYVMIRLPVRNAPVPPTKK